MFRGGTCPAFGGCLKAEGMFVLKRLVLRAARGFSITVAVCMLIQLAVAQLAGSTVTPDFGARFRCEGAATLAQLGLTGLIGAIFASGSMLFEIERWSYLKQGAVHFLLTAAACLPVVRLCWTPVSGWGLWLTIGGWTLTYAINWLVQYFIYRRRIADLNRHIQAFHGGGNADAGD